MARSVGLVIILWSVTTLGFADGVDPTRPINIKSFDAPTAGTGKVSFILVSPKRTLAIINGQQVTVGDRVGNQEVMGIYPDRVELLDNGTGDVEVDYFASTKVKN